MLKVQGLQKRFGSLKAVRGLDFEVQAGETFGLLGPNGAGKSTTIHMLCGALAPDGGKVSIDGGDPLDPAVRARIAVAPQKLSLYEDLTGEENLAFFGRLYGLGGPALGQRVREAIAFAGLEDKAGKRVKTYSGGMQRRLNLACAILHEPRALFLDEPTAGVDPQSRNRLFENIEELKRRGCTILYTTHYMEEAERLCDRVAIMDEGRILDLDTVPGLVARHGGHAKVTAEMLAPPPEDAVAPGPIDGTSLSFSSSRPLDDLLELRQAGWQLGGFKVERPDLENVFLSLTGKKLRDS